MSDHSSDPSDPLGQEVSDERVNVSASPTVFLEPQLYRRRRLIDAARLLPVFGMFLLIVPPDLLPEGTGSSTTSLLVYLVMVWTALVVAAAVVGRYMRVTETQKVPDTGLED